MTPNQVKALKIISDNGPLRPREFARLFWGTDHPGWKRRGKAGPKGTMKGQGLMLAAGGYLGKLAKKGWIRPEYSYWDRGHYEGYVMTRRGSDALEKLDQ